MLEIPNQKNLAFYVIAVLMSVSGTLGTLVFQQASECEMERRKEKFAYEKRISDCQEQARIDAKEAAQRLTSFLMRQDSISQAHLREIQKLRRR